MGLLISADPWHTIVIGLFCDLNLHYGGFWGKGTRLSQSEASNQKKG